jgi:hypothetical protein
MPVVAPAWPDVLRDHVVLYLFPDPIGPFIGVRPPWWCAQITNQRAMIAVDAVLGIAIALPRGRQQCGRCCEESDAAPCRRLAGLLAGPFFLISVG